MQKNTIEQKKEHLHSEMCETCKKMGINIHFMRNQNYNKLIYILRTHNLEHFDDQYLEKRSF